MKFKLLGLIPWMVLTAASLGQLKPAEVRFTHYPAFNTGVSRLGDECFVPISELKHFDFKVEDDAGIAKIEFAGNKARISIRSIAGKPSVPLRQTVEKLGGYSDWDESGTKLNVFSKILSISATRAGLKVETSFPIQANAFTLAGPDRIVLDLPNTVIDYKASQMFDDMGRATQFRPSVVRVVLETDVPVEIPKAFQKPSKIFEVMKDSLVEKPADPEPDNVKRPDVPLQIVAPGHDEGSYGGSYILTPTVKPEAARSPEALVTNLGAFSVQMDRDRQSIISLKFSAPIGTRCTLNPVEPTLLHVIVPSSKITIENKPDISAIKEFKVETSGDTSTLIFRLARPMGAELSANGDELTLQLIKPDVGNGKLAGKTIVIDAGHGGNDTGARSPDGNVNEKDITLSVANKVAQKLTAQGANVILTRKSDVLISLAERPAIGVRSNANFFISIHVNSVTLNNSVSGSMVFYHRYDAINQLLAKCILTEISRVSGLPDMGTHSDLTVAKTKGYAVLRGSKCPSVLIELGFINNSKDRSKLTDEGFQYLVSSAICRGLKVYLGDSKSE